MFSRNFVLLAAFATSFPVFAQTTAVSADQHGREAERIAEINERIAVMSAQLAELEMQAKISAKLAEIGKSNDSARSEIGKSNDSARSFLKEENFIPSVREISGADGRIWAVLNVPDGNTQTVRVGDLVGGWRVVEIRPDAVSVKRGSDTLRLSFSFSPTQTAAPAAGGQSGGPLPPFPLN